MASKALQFALAFNLGAFFKKYLAIITKKPDLLDIEILGVLILENSIAWETKRFFGS